MSKQTHAASPWIETNKQSHLINSAGSNILKGKMIPQRWHVGIWNEMNIVPVKVQ